jgi:SpoVK/Ycf46/Vps4 family AAA+-type ATPase
MKQGIFDEVCELPDPNAKRRFDALIGIDSVKRRLLKETVVMLDYSAMKNWLERHHAGAASIALSFKERAPLLIFAGDVGTGKTVLAETLGDAIARTMNIGVTLYSLSLSARGTGAVGEMTALLSAAFSEIRSVASKGAKKGGKPTQAIVLLIDEADAIAQSREMSQMHHEDRAGVNAIIRGVDDLATEQLPVLVIMCTNRLSALDPAVRRRAAITIEFLRPNDEQRGFILGRAFLEVGFSPSQIGQLVRATGSNGGRDYGFTCSDLVQRYIPAVILECFPDSPVSFAIAASVAESMVPTPPFKEK